MKTICLLGILLGLASCAGYHFENTNNPFEENGIKSVAIPVFVNQTVFANINGPLTREITRFLQTYPGLRVYPGESKSADAILVGIVRSNKYRSKAIETTSTKFTTGELQESIGGRKGFYIPSGTSYSVTLDLILIKDPSRAEMKLLDSELGKYMDRHPKVIFKEGLALTGSFTRVVDSNLGPDDGGVVNYTKNKALLEKSFDDLAENAADTFKEIVINAF